MKSYSFAAKTPSESFKLLIQGEIRKVYVSSLFICPQQRGDSSPHSELSLVSLAPGRAQPTVGHKKKKKTRGVQPPRLVLVVSTSNHSPQKAMW